MWKEEEYEVEVFRGRFQASAFQLEKLLREISSRFPAPNVLGYTSMKKSATAYDFSFYNEAIEDETYLGFVEIIPSEDTSIETVEVGIISRYRLLELWKVFWFQLRKSYIEVPLNPDQDYMIVIQDSVYASNLSCSPEQVIPADTILSEPIGDQTPPPEKNAANNVEEKISNTSQMKAYYKDYNPETARAILVAIPNAWKENQRMGRRWGPGIIAKKVNLAPAVTSRYLAAFKKAGITEIVHEGKTIPIPHNFRTNLISES
jgi:hypothetical protein